MVIKIGSIITCRECHKKIIKKYPRQEDCLSYECNLKRKRRQALNSYFRIKNKKLNQEGG